jgi:hypothetical protein
MEMFQYLPDHKCRISWCGICVGAKAPSNNRLAGLLEMTIDMDLNLFA